MATEIVAVVLCLLGSSFFSCSETALSSLAITRLEAMRALGGRFTRAGVDRWSSAPQELLITILVGNNLVNVLASALATRIAYRLTDDGGLAWVVGGMTLIILVFGEITPKTLAQRYAQGIALRVLPVLYVLDVVLRPVNRVLGAITTLLTPQKAEEAPVTEEDLLFLLRLAHRHAQLPRDSRIMIEAVLRFQRTVAREVMIPRPRVATVDASWSLSTLRETVATEGHSRFPVTRGGPDEILGVFHAKFLQRVAEGEDWTQMTVPAVFIPESKKISELLHDLRKKGQHMAIVLDEYGGFAGIVTLEDALELLVGEIEDEFDRERSPEIERTGDSVIVPAHLGLRRLERLLHTELRPSDVADSVGGLAATLIGQGLRRGSRARWGRLELEIIDLEDDRPSRIRVRICPTTERTQAP